MVGFRKLAVLAGLLAPFGAAAPVESAPVDIDHKFIITLKSNISEADIQSHLSWVEQVHKRSLGRRDLAGLEKTFNIADFHAYSGTFDDETIDELKNNPEVVSIEPEQIYTLSDFVSQPNAPWGLATLSSRRPGASTYWYHDSTGSGTYAYVVDSGIHIQHADFGGRAARGYNAAGGAFEDSLGHGTHVAGIIGGTTHGVAKAARLIDVKVFIGPSTSTSVILSGISWAVNDALTNNRASRSVINLSLSGPLSAAWNNAINAAHSVGVLSVVASGNDDVLASTRSPASAVNALTVGAIDSTWTEASFSNYGSAVDILAPGVDIRSLTTGTSTGTRLGSGTSMAAPHVAGLALYLAVLENINSPNALKARIHQLATVGAVRRLKPGSPNLIVYNGIALRGALV
ncbi:alkaline proteinase [Sodiomyces alkalinus F11]|uniref:Alkaline proteinase n=1 Tax=Sodiomyces alkalinus (strain CBS 110278 / VKM F-3762 / F11) TaxID=1314773 RepID=A0A3N2PUM3_SODAK|nr:alkaline proteinase [Sodiomyces alkalinus F11]ROT38191.1 alkaline proteinase [Sodiomyces alkalinus F11]